MTIQPVSKKIERSAKNPTTVSVNSNQSTEVKLWPQADQHTNYQQQINLKINTNGRKSNYRNAENRRSSP
jgi:hypothetical protein